MADDTSTRSWDDIADDWVVHADSNDYRNHYLMPRMLAMLGQISGKAVLDLGCGEGGTRAPSYAAAPMSPRLTAARGSSRSPASGRAPSPSTCGSFMQTRMHSTSWRQAGSRSSSRQ